MYMRNIFIVLALVVMSTVAFDAAACARCRTTPEGCQQCYESSGDGAQGCDLWQGEYCLLTNDGTCEGWDNSWCQGERCPEDLEALRVQPEREWQLASYQVIRPAAAKSTS